LMTPAYRELRPTVDKNNYLPIRIACFIKKSAVVRAFNYLLHRFQEHI